MLWSLSTRLFVLIAAVMLAGLFLLSWVVVEMHTHALEAEVVRGALRLSDTLRRSMRTSMLRNRKEDVYEIIRTVGNQPGIERIRIFNKEGEIMFSTAPREVGETVDKQAEACTRCHTGSEPVPHLEGPELARFFSGADGGRLLGLITPIYNEKGCSSSSCHAPVEEQKVLGVVDTQASLAGIDASLGEQKRQYQYFTYFFMLVTATTCGLFVWRFVHVPVKELIAGTERIKAGQLDHRIPLHSKTEIGRLAESFNLMAEELGRARKQLTDWSETLEHRVDEKTRTLQQAQAKLVQNEKMASLGTLSAVVAHEINNPLSGVLTYARLVRKMVGDSGPKVERVPEIVEYLKTMEAETARCGNIVKNLLEFSRHSGMVVGEVALNDTLDKTLFLIGHKLELQGIELTKSFSPELPRIVCDADQIQQALLAVLLNAVEAMPEGGGLHVSTSVTRPEGEVWTEVRIRDTGVGIPEEAIPQLFEPFFTTKQDKKGVGLGLAVVYGILKRHQGKIEVQSEVGKGTTFVLSLPDRPEAERELCASSEDEVLPAPSDGEET